MAEASINGSVQAGFRADLLDNKRDGEGVFDFIQLCVLTRGHGEEHSEYSLSKLIL